MNSLVRDWSKQKLWKTLAQGEGEWPGLFCLESWGQLRQSLDQFFVQFSSRSDGQGSHLSNRGSDPAKGQTNNTQFTLVCRSYVA